MKILIIDDSVENQESALHTLAGHELTIAKTTVEAQNLLRADGFAFDAVLTDLFMPLPEKEWNGGKYWVYPFGRKYGTCVTPESCEGEHPVGTCFALMAASRGAKLVAVVSNLSHHEHPVAVQLDSFRQHKEKGVSLRVNNAHLMLINEPAYVEMGNGRRGKDWAWVLEKLENSK